MSLPPPPPPHLSVLPACSLLPIVLYLIEGDSELLKLGAPGGDLLVEDVVVFALEQLQFVCVLLLHGVQLCRQLRDLTGDKT